MAIDMIALLVEQATEATNEANEVQSRILAATTDRTKAIHDMLTDEESTDETIKAHQAWIEQANAEIEKREKQAYEYAESKQPPQDEDAVKADQAKHKALVEQVKSALAYAKKIPGYTDEKVKDIPALKNPRGKDSSAGSGSKRPRLIAASYRVGTKGPWTEATQEKTEKDGTKVNVTNFTVLALALKDALKAKVEVKELQAAAFAAAGTDDLSTLNGKPVEFAFTVNDQNVFIKVAPKQPEAKPEETVAA